MQYKHSATIFRTYNSPHLDIRYPTVVKNLCSHFQIFSSEATFRYAISASHIIFLARKSDHWPVDKPLYLISFVVGYFHHCFTSTTTPLPSLMLRKYLSLLSYRVPFLAPVLSYCLVFFLSFIFACVLTSKKKLTSWFKKLT